MHLLHLTLPDLAGNLALDEALLLQAEAGAGEVLRIWQWPTPAVVLGAGCRLAEDVDATTCAKDGISILRRSSGGGTVLLGHGCLLYSLILSYERSPMLGEVRPSFAYILDRLAGALGRLAAPVERAGISDLVMAGRKFSGNSQQRKRHHLLHHGTLLFEFNLDLVGRYLTIPKRQPDYRSHRPHHEFLCNFPATVSDLTGVLEVAWGSVNPTTSWPSDLVGHLRAQKYEQTEWISRR